MRSREPTRLPGTSRVSRIGPIATGVLRHAQLWATTASGLLWVTATTHEQANPKFGVRTDTGLVETRAYPCFT